MAGLTVKAIEMAKPRAGRYEKPDAVAGLYLVVQPSGAKSWALRFRSPTVRGKDGQRAAKKLTLGTVSLGASNSDPQIGQPLTLTQARMLATRALETVRQGIDPTETRRVEKAKARQDAAIDNSVDAAMVEFLKRYRGKKKQGLRDSTRKLTATYFGLKPDPDAAGDWIKSGSGVLKHWSGRPLGSITKHDAITLLDKLVDAGNGVTANRTLTNLKTFFAWCVKRDLLTASPVAILDAVAEEHSRERVLDDIELTALWRAAAAEGYPFGRLIQLLALTGCRRDEPRNAPWTEFELNEASIALPNGKTWLGPLWSIPAKRTKNNREHLIPLTPLMLSVVKSLPSIGDNKLLFTLTGTTPISGLSKAKRRLDDAMAVELKKIDPAAEFKGWSPHDLRRTLYTGLQRLGFSIEIAEACVNHKSGTLRGVAAVYGRYQYLAEKTAAFEAWSRHVDGLTNGSVGADVIPLHGARS